MLLDLILAAIAILPLATMSISGSNRDEFRSRRTR